MEKDYNEILRADFLEAFQGLVEKHPELTKWYYEEFVPSWTKAIEEYEALKAAE
jgi:hypothetical protein